MTNWLHLAGIGSGLLLKKNTDKSPIVDFSTRLCYCANYGSNPLQIYKGFHGASFLPFMIVLGYILFNTNYKNYSIGFGSASLPFQPRGRFCTDLHLHR